MTLSKSCFAGLSYDQAERRHSQGLMSDLDWRWYKLIWTWAAARFSHPAGDLQDRYAERMGYEALLRRRERIRRIAVSKGFLTE